MMIFTALIEFHFLKLNKWINAVAYGLIVQTLMSFVILPLSNIAPRTFTGFLQNAVILMFAIGLPSALSAERFYAQNDK